MPPSSPWRSTYPVPLLANSYSRGPFSPSVTRCRIQSPAGRSRTISRTAWAGAASGRDRTFVRGRPVRPARGGTAQAGSAVHTSVVPLPPLRVPARRTEVDRGDVPEGHVSVVGAPVSYTHLRAHET